MECGLSLWDSRPAVMLAEYSRTGAEVDGVRVESLRTWWWVWFRAEEGAEFLALKHRRVVIPISPES